MFARSVRLALLTSPDKISPQLASSIKCPLKIYIDLSRQRYLRNLADLTAIMSTIEDLSGVHIKLSQLRSRGLIELLSRILTRDMRLLVTVDRPCTVYMRNTLHGLAVSYNLTPVIDLSDPLDKLPVLEIKNLDFVMFKLPDKVTRRLIVALPYLKDYLNTLLKIRKIAIGSLVNELKLEVLNVLRDIVASSSIIVSRDLDLIVQICEGLRRRLGLPEILQECTLNGRLAIDLNIE